MILQRTIKWRTTTELPAQVTVVRPTPPAARTRPGSASHAGRRVAPSADAAPGATRVLVTGGSDDGVVPADVHAGIAHDISDML